MKTLMLIAALFIGLGTTASLRAAETASPDIFQVTVPVTFLAGNAYVQGVPVVTTPSNKRLVIQTVSFYRANGSSGSGASLFIATTIFNNTSFWAIPEVYQFSGEVAFPATTLSATFYAGAGTNVYINGYRNGDLTGSETLYAAISGYYVQKP